MTQAEQLNGDYPERTSYADTLSVAGDFLLDRMIEPTPSNYDVAYRCSILGDPKLMAAIDNALLQGYVRDLGIVAAQAGLDSPVVSPEELDIMVTDAQHALVRIADIARQSGADAIEYGQALTANIADLAPVVASHPALNALVEITDMMIRKSRKAEDSLLEAGKRIETMQKTLNEARHQAETDALTGIGNRRSFEIALHSLAKNAQERGESLSLAFCDIDHFKLVNDTFGHDVGDRVLRYVARLLGKMDEANFHVARHGGEEFVLLMPGKSAEEAFDVVENAREMMASKRLTDRESGRSLGTITFSGGVASLGSDGNISHLMKRADVALYKAKESGRNKICIGDNAE